MESRGLQAQQMAQGERPSHTIRQTYDHSFSKRPLILYLNHHEQLISCSQEQQGRQLSSEIQERWNSVSSIANTKGYFFSADELDKQLSLSLFSPMKVSWADRIHHELLVEFKSCKSKEGSSFLSELFLVFFQFVWWVMDCHHLNYTFKLFYRKTRTKNTCF